MVALLAAALALSGCGSFARSGETREADAPETVAVGEGVRFAEPTSSTTSAAPTTTETPALAPDGDDVVAEGKTGFAILVKGPDGRPRAGVPAKVTGTVERSIVSDLDGVLRLATPGGRYEVRIEPTCGERVQVETSAVGRIAVPVGEVVRGELVVSARRRHFPGAPVTYKALRPTRETESSGRRWKLGTPYVVRFTMIDRCTGEPAPGASVDGLQFSAPGAVEVALQEAKTAGADGTALLRAICRAEAPELQLFAIDAAVPDDRVDLFSRAVLDDTAPDCVP